MSTVIGEKYGGKATKNVTNGATVTDTAAILTSGSATFSVLSITGTDTVWRDAGNPSDPANPYRYMIVGDSSGDVPGGGAAMGTARLTVSGRARLIETSHAFIGHGRGSQGQADVSDGGIWTIGKQSVGFARPYGALGIGLNGGSGLLRVLNGGTVDLGGGNDTLITNGQTLSAPWSLAAGVDAGSSGTVIVAGAGAKLSSGGVVDIGEQGEGTLLVGGLSDLSLQDGGTVSAFELDVGLKAGSNGLVRIGTAGSVTAVVFDIGFAGNGTVEVNGGGHLTGIFDGSQMRIGGSTGGIGALFVNGGTVASSVITVGAGGQGQVSVAGGALVASAIDVGTSGRGRLVVADAGTATISGGLHIGVVSGGTGTVLVSGGTLVGHQISVGESGSGLLSVGAGGMVNIGTHTLTIGSGTVSVDGTNARLLAGSMWLSNSLANGDTARLSVGTGAVVQSGSATMSTNTVVELNGGLLIASGLTMQANSTVHGYGRVDGAISTAGTVIAEGGLLELGGALSALPAAGPTDPLSPSPSKTSTGAVQISNHGTLQLDAASSGVSITFGTGRDQMLILRAPGTSFAVPLRGLFNNDVIAFTFAGGMTIASARYIAATSDIEITRSDNSTYLLTDATFDAGADTSLLSGYDAATGNAFIQVACFASGTLIETTTGEVPVEALTKGTRLRTVLGGTEEPIIWLGHRHVNCVAHPEPRKVWPVRVSSGAFGADLPKRDLWLSPDHAVFINDVLIPVIRLVNGTSIRQIPVPEVTYWHVELRRHDVIRAEGLPAESYLATGDRSNFENGGGPVRLFPDFNARMWEAQGCAELVQVGPKLLAVRKMLARLAEQAANTTGAPRLRSTKVRR